MIGSVVGLMIAMRMSKSFNKTVQESLYFKNHPRFAHNALVRKTLSLPDVWGASFDDCDGTRSENSSLLDQQDTSTSPTKYSNERTGLSNNHHQYAPDNRPKPPPNNNGAVWM